MEHIVQAIIALLAITNPVGAAPIFLSLTGGFSAAQRRRAVFRGVAAAVAILVAAALAGTRILSAIGISLPAFQAAGGLVILLMGLEMLRGSKSLVQHDPDAPAKEGDPIIVPFAMPLIAGPGAITTVVTLASHGQGPQALVNPLIGIAVAGVALVASLLFSSWLEARVSYHGHGVLLRFMGLLLLAIGAQLLLEGVKASWIS